MISSQSLVLRQPSLLEQLLFQFYYIWRQGIAAARTKSLGQHENLSQPLHQVTDFQGFPNVGAYSHCAVVAEQCRVAVAQGAGRYQGQFLGARKSIVTDAN